MPNQIQGNDHEPTVSLSSSFSYRGSFGKPGCPIRREPVTFTSYNTRAVLAMPPFFFAA